MVDASSLIVHNSWNRATLLNAMELSEVLFMYSCPESSATSPEAKDDAYREVMDRCFKLYDLATFGSNVYKVVECVRDITKELKQHESRMRICREINNLMGGMGGGMVRKKLAARTYYKLVCNKSGNVQLVLTS